MGLFNRNRVEVPTTNEQELIATTLLINSVFQQAQTQLENGYASTIASYANNLRNICETQVGDLLINAYQRHGQLIKHDKLATTHALKHEGELNLETMAELIDLMDDYVAVTQETFEDNELSNDEVIEEIISRAELITTYVRLIQSAIVIDTSGFEIKSAKASDDTEQQVYGRYV
jgi:hypothetical protein